VAPPPLRRARSSLSSLLTCDATSTARQGVPALPASPARPARSRRRDRPV